MTNPSLTPSQLRALEWLPEDGSWRWGTIHMGTCLFLLRKARPDAVEYDSSWKRWRLTPAGIELMKRAKE